MKHKIIVFVACVLLPLTMSAQNAREVLDATAARLTDGGVRAQFKATQFNGATPAGEAAGTLLMHGRAYYVDTDELKAWCDGTTGWTMLNGSDEVNVTTPTEAEQARLNPATLIGIYKQGYRFSLSKGTLRGKAVFTVHMKARNKRAVYSDIYVDVEQRTYTPLCFRAKSDGNWTRLAVLDFQSGLTLPPATFAFPAKDYPDVEVIDLR